MGETAKYAGAGSGEPAKLPFARQSALVFWALMPVLSLGLLLPLPSIHFAVRHASPRTWGLASGYLAMWLASWTLIFLFPNNAALAGIMFCIILGTSIAATIQAWHVRCELSSKPNKHELPPAR
jgi:hypothetical protein